MANRTDWTREYIDWCTTRTGSEPRKYAHPDIRSGLETETSSKCAYCEGFINDVAYSHIEHKRPKRKNPELVCDWENLTIGCPRCNTNKGDYDDPACPLLDPYSDSVEDEISFYGPMAFARGGASAKMTIGTLKLNRTELQFARGSALSRASQIIDTLARAHGERALQIALWADLDAMCDGSHEFSSAVRYFVEAACLDRGVHRP